MNQPKYKFGDKLKVTSPNYLPFTVNRIDWNKHYEQYEYNDSALESALEPYQEPQKKKLYAYSVQYVAGLNADADCGIKFFREERPNHFSPRGDYRIHRAPEYDIEYPEAK